MPDQKRPYHHGPNNRFRNPEGSPRREGSRKEMGRFIRKQMLSRFREEIPSGHVLEPAEFARQLAQASNPSLTWLGHSAFIIRLGGKMILTDPFLGERAGPFGFGPKRYVPAPMQGQDLPQADVLLVSHNHYDHLDAPTINAYPYKAQTQVIVPLGLGEFFRKRGYLQVTEQDWWQEWQTNGLRISTLPAIHNSGRGLHDRNKTLWASFGIHTEQGSIWFSGDTAYGPIFDEIANRSGPFDLALVAIGAYEPRKLMKGAHVTPNEAAEIARILGVGTAIGMHWGTIALTPEYPFDAPKEFRRAAAQSGASLRHALGLRVGETLNLLPANLEPLQKQ